MPIPTASPSHTLEEHPHAHYAGYLTEEERIRPLHLSQMLLYGAGGIAGGLVFTMLNNALPLMLMGYTMPPDVPQFMAPGQPVPAQIVALLANERSLFGGLVQPVVGALSDRTHTRIGKHQSGAHGRRRSSDRPRGSSAAGCAGAHARGSGGERGYQPGNAESHRDGTGDAEPGNSRVAERRTGSSPCYPAAGSR